MKRLALVLCLAVSVFSTAALALDDPSVDPSGVVAPTMPAPVVVPLVVVPPPVKIGQVANPNDPNPPSDVVAVLKTVHSLAVGKEWGRLLFLAITLLVWASRKFFEPRLPWLAGPVATVIKTFAIAFTGMLATSWGPGRTPTSSDIFTALQMGFAASGGWSILKTLLEAAAKKWSFFATIATIVIGKPKPA